ncbi:DUF7679 family protein [Limosilactobacillus fastidiosus]|uniref:Uncharacterized protein n=1 Tax=Limosilactobacillus fastidiosus TaxID=2759855 RepID=A0A7W3TY32_9LACO|nr:hypothetical protein [Limosilactobacillus fastidiosus]MBB1063191.1 hypothetical protein [Limosilactobacillus fastidiosus]MBB1085393.1 hypothetical protein [Limosilactobacillus fastidiosus]MCD7083695.1 hypothetical protein [Limosilactobacillus fastidiosus]MCD7085375.1 hypothetical protein [Limosilactobacillus fastidiosus]MCD7114860.1 hypothetical protein [Limosilactobacillus fastidiosus]
MDGKSQIDIRKLSFRDRALYELKVAKATEKRTYYWVQVRLTNGKKKWFQLPKDLQKAMHTSTFELNEKRLVGALINIPISKYKKNGKVKIDCGIICKLSLRNYHAKKPNKITRSQFKQPNRRFGFANSSELFGYLKHDYDQENQERIRQSIHELMVPGFVSFVVDFLLPLCVTFFVYYLIYCVSNTVIR